MNRFNKKFRLIPILIYILLFHCPFITIDTSPTTIMTEFESSFVTSTTSAATIISTTVISSESDTSSASSSSSLNYDAAAAAAAVCDGILLWKNESYGELRTNNGNLSMVAKVPPPVKKKDPLFPTDPFTKSQRQRGLVLFHLFGMVYMFVALATVCDEFFVPSLDVIIEKFQINDDVAGATFMAAGGSAPELFTSVMGVFVCFDDVGIGTIVGSAVFNVLFVIGTCAVFSGSVLTLTWWPLFRDCLFYAVSLICLIVFFHNNYIHWYESVGLLSIYTVYVIFMRWNNQAERFVKQTLLKQKVTRVCSSDQLMPNPQAAARTLNGEDGTTSSSSTSRKAPSTTTKFRHGLLQLMIHTIDPMQDVSAKVDEKAAQLHAVASLRALLDASKPRNSNNNNNIRGVAGSSSSTATMRKIQTEGGRSSVSTAESIALNGAVMNASTSSPADEEEEDEPMDLSWPKNTWRQIFYVLAFPIIFCLWATLPDMRKKSSKKFFVFTFLGSIIWIAIFSYLMVWWATVAGETYNVPSEVMGLTVLAAGTSVPDLITSVIVARKGCGDMAVSSSVGSNIFDITVGLPFPWLVYNIITGCPVKVNSAGMACSISMLFLMLLFVVVSIACFNWKMNHGLGYTMYILYMIFLIFSLLFEYEYIKCPV